jgi:uncharacterized protein
MNAAEVSTSRLSPHRLRWLKLLAVATTLCYAIVVLFACLFEDRIVFRPVTAAERWIDASPSLPFRDLELDSDDGVKISARWFPCAGSSKAVLYCHPRGGNLSIALKSRDIEELQRQTSRSVLVFDYPGYGKSTGTPSESGCYSSARAAYEWLTGSAGINADRVLIVGRSLGTGVAVDLAGRVPCEALVLISPYTTLPEAGQFRCPVLPARWLMRNQFDSLSKISRCSCPILLVHGTKDDWVPFDHSRRLFAAAHEPKRLSIDPGANHSDQVLVGFFETLAGFLKSL